MSVHSYRPLVGIALLGLSCHLILAEEHSQLPPVDKPLSAAEQASLEKDALRLNKEMHAAVHAGQLQAALDKAEKSLQLCKRRYPSGEYPDGHSNLATALNGMGVLLGKMGKLKEALPYLRDTVAMDRKLYPQDKYRDGHAHLANSLDTLAAALAALGQPKEALPYCQEGLKMRQKLFAAEWPDGHPAIATSLNNMGAILESLDQPEEALSYAVRAVAMLRTLSSKWAEALPDLATSLDGLGVILRALGRTEEALPHCEEALDLRKKLYGKLPNGHPDLASSFNNVGTLLRDLGEPQKALTYCDQAARMLETFYGKLPDGHGDLATGLNQLGAVLLTLDQPEKALEYFERAHQMRKRLYGARPEGDPSLVNSHDLMAAGLLAVGKFDDALCHCKQALEMSKQLHGNRPNGHPLLGSSFNSMGGALLKLGRPIEALPLLQEALAISKKQPDDHFNWATSLQNVAFAELQLGAVEKARTHAREGLEIRLKQYRRLSAIAATPVVQKPLWESRVAAFFVLNCSPPTSDAEAYHSVWQVKGLATLSLQARYTAALAALPKSSKVQDIWKDFVAVQHQIAHLTLDRLPDAALSRTKEDSFWQNRNKLLLSLHERRDQLEQELAKALPQMDRAKEWASSKPGDLQQRMPNKVVFIDFLRYVNYDPQDHSWKYVAFVVAPGQSVKRVELGDAATLDHLCDDWCGKINAWAENDTARDAIAQRVWAKLAPHIPLGTRTVYLSPDGNLARIPWSALPGAKQDKVLLEDFQGGIATVPNGVWLLDQLKHPMEFPKGEEPVLLVGEVETLAGSRDYLPGSPYEVRNIRGLAEQPALGQRRVIPLTGNQPTPQRVRQELPGCRYAHFSCHGFFDADSLGQERRREAEAVQNWPSSMHGDWQPAGLGARNPLSYTWLQLANGHRANGEQATSAQTPELTGILTGDHLLGLDLRGLRLAVLSACQTGLGDLTAAEGVEGLQRAFHVSGCPNVVASLWATPDWPGVILMTAFYRELWENGKPPLEALRAAQLYVYYHPELIRQATAEGGLDPNQVVPGKGPSGGRRSRTYQWAAFVLSGTGK